MIFKQMKMFFISVLCSYLLCTYFIFDGINSETYMLNGNLSLNNSFRIQKKGVIEDEEVILVLIHNKLNDKDIDYCSFVSKITQKDDYYIGYIINENISEEFPAEVKNDIRKKNEICRGYFFVNKNTEEAKFNLSEKEIENKFGESLNYEEAYKYINKYGEGGDIKRDLKDHIFFSFLFMPFFILFFWGFQNLIYVIKMILKIRKNKKI